jgi:hypothetical protein
MPSQITKYKYSQGLQMGSIIRWERDEKLTVSLQLADSQELKKLYGGV